MERKIHDLLASHPFFEGIDPDTLKLICGCGKNVRFAEKATLFREGEDANAFYAIREGRVAIQLHAPGRGPVTIMTVGAGDILGWSWLFPPYRWLYDGIALEATRAVEFDGQCLRRKCDADTAMGYDLMKRFAQVFARRLEQTRLQILDVYGTAPSL